MPKTLTRQVVYFSLQISSQGIDSNNDASGNATRTYFVIFHQSI